ncbi:MAG TPA: hypothetical protein VGM94_04050 [Galbitalea sp.]|jgi:hypothetical protein
MTSSWRRSPQEVDPLSWFAGPGLPVVLSIAAVLQGAVIAILYWGLWSNVALQFAAMPFFLFAGWLTATWVQPHRPQFDWRKAIVVLMISTLGVVVSAVGTVGGHMAVQQWWPGIALGATLASLAPYSSARQLVGYGILAAVPLAFIGWAVFSPITHIWTPAGVIAISSGPVVVAGVASIVFSYTIVSRTTAFLDTSAADEEVYSALEPRSEAEEMGGTARVSARVAPFIESVAAAGVITPTDRALAAQIARSLRAELVTASNRSWLDVVAAETGMVVSDPGRLADRMNESQRAALRGLLVAAIENSVVDRYTLLIELRAQPDGSTAVALSIDLDLPEGRRFVLIAPYYLTLKTTVDDLSWDDGRSLMLKFRIPPS